MPPPLTSKCRAFSGKGVSLLGGTAECPSTSERGKSADAKRTGCDGQEGSSTGAVVPAASAPRSAASGGNAGSAQTDAQLAQGVVDADWPGESGRRSIEGSKSDGVHGSLGGGGVATAGNGSSSVPGAGRREAAGGGGMVLGEGALSATSATPARGRSCGTTAADASALGAVGSGAEVTACGCCGNLVPTANLRLHGLRCRSSQGARRQRHPPRVSPAESRTELERPVSPTPSETCTTKASATPALARPTEAASNAEFPCAYCGLTFREAGPAGEHEEACGTRTERCDRCCSHVPRRNAESHRCPGGGCDAVIAAAEEHEKRAKAAGRRRLTLNVKESGSGDGGAGKGGNGSMGGRFDALLAEAVRSSGAAATALAEARAENDARMLEAVETAPRAGGGGLLHTRRYIGGHGGGDSEYDCVGKQEDAVCKPEKAAADATEGAAKVHSGGLGTTPDALEPGCAGTSADPEGARGSETHGRESGTNHTRLAARVSAASPPSIPVPSLVSRQTSSGASFSTSFRPTPDPPAPPTHPAASSHNRTNTSDDARGESSAPCESLSPHRPGSRNAACRRESGSWACLRCTLINPRPSSSCEVCGSAAPGTTPAVLKGDVSGGTRPGTKLSNSSDRSMDSGAETAAGGLPAAAAQATAEEDLREVPVAATGVEIDEAVQDAAKEARAPTVGSPHQSQTTTGTPVPLWGAAAAFPPDWSHPPGRASPSRERRTQLIAGENPPAAALASPLPAAGSSENTRASGSAPQTFSVRNNASGTGSGSRGGLERVGAGQVLPLQTRHTAPATSSNAPSAAGAGAGLVGSSAAGVAAPRARCLGSPASFVPANIGVHPLRPRPRCEAAAPQGARGVRRQKQRYECATREPRRAGQPRALTGRRRLMGPPRRLGGAHRPSRLRCVPPSPPPSSSLVAPPADAATTTAAAASAAVVLNPGLLPVREVVGASHDRRHSHEHPRASSSLDPFCRPNPSLRPALRGGLGGSVGRSNLRAAAVGPPSSSAAAPACDISLSVLGRSQGRGGGGGGASHGTPMPSGGRAGIGGAEPGERSRRPGQENELAASFKHEAGGGIGAWGRRCGGGGGAAAAAAVGVAPLKLRRRVNDTRVLEPLVAR